MTTTAEIPKQRLPIWAVTLMFFVVAAIITVSGSVLSVLMYARRVAVDATIPSKIEQVAQEIAKFPQPLPVGYKNIMGADFKTMQFLVMEHTPSKQQFTFYSVPFAWSDNDPKHVLDKAYDMGIITVTSASAKFHDLKSRGKEKIGGQEMNYLMGEYTDPVTNKKADGFIGCVSLSKTAKNILIYSFPDPERAYNQQVTMDLLNSLKEF